MSAADSDLKCRAVDIRKLSNSNGLLDATRIQEGLLDCRDIDLMLATLWLRPDDIPMPAQCTSRWTICSIGPTSKIQTTSRSLGWKESILDKKIFRARYADFCEVFYRLLLVMGFCDYARLYPLHLNAASVLLGIYPNGILLNSCPILIIAWTVSLGRWRALSSATPSGRETLPGPCLRGETSL